MNPLQHKKCVPCEVGALPLSAAQISELITQLPSAWRSIDTTRLFRTFKFKDFKEAMAFGNAVAIVAESEGHHPDMTISYGQVDISLTTHSIGGLSENDFILAMKIELAYGRRNDGVSE